MFPVKFKLNKTNSKTWSTL